LLSTYLTADQIYPDTLMLTMRFLQQHCLSYISPLPLVVQQSTYSWVIHSSTCILQLHKKTRAGYRNTVSILPTVTH